MASQADRIRQYALDHYVLPTIASGGVEIVIRAGDVHRDMGLRDAMPNVCSAIRSPKFHEFAGLVLLEQTGPHAGPNACFRFRKAAALTNPATAAIRPPSGPDRVMPQRSAARSNVDLTGALVLVSCVKSKRSQPTQARDLYLSDWFLKVRALVEASHARWLILSALHGLIEPDKTIAPYERTLNTLGVADRRTWANSLLPELVATAQKFERVVVFAGERYREFICPALKRHNVRVEIPMEGLTIGKQLSWLSRER